MPKLKIAKQAAALDAIEKLHRCGELDHDHVKPIIKEQVDSDEEDEEKMEEKKQKHAGTQRRLLYYKHEVGR